MINLVEDFKYLAEYQNIKNASQNNNLFFLFPLDSYGNILDFTTENPFKDFKCFDMVFSVAKLPL